MSKDSKIQLGAKPLVLEGVKDAIHVAVVCVEAGEPLRPGDKVVMIGKQAFKTNGGDFIGVVDPFLNERVPSQTYFYLCLRPGTITNLRHEWDHPDFNYEDSSSNWQDDGYDECRGCD